MKSGGEDFWVLHEEEGTRAFWEPEPRGVTRACSRRLTYRCLEEEEEEGEEEQEEERIDRNLGSEPLFRPRWTWL